MANPNKKGPTANEVTAGHCAVARELLNEVRDILDDYEKRADHNHASWGHAGEAHDIMDSLLRIAATKHPDYTSSESDARSAVLARVHEKLEAAEEKTPLRFHKKHNTFGSSLVGYFTATFDEVVNVFGSPHFEDRGGKLETEWAFELDNGTVFTIYDYYHPEGTSRNGEAYRWHIGGFNEGALRAVESAGFDVEGLE